MSFYQVGADRFKTKASVKARASDILDESDIGVPLPAPANAFVNGLFAYYPNPAREQEKLRGREIAHFEVGIKRGEDWFRRVFIIIFVDGTRDDFSISKAIKNMKPVDGAA